MFSATKNVLQRQTNTLVRKLSTKVTTLPNGVRVATESFDVPTASVGIFIDAGSSFENSKNNGTAHFLEHMSFKGTQSRTKAQIEKDTENLGMHLNAYTSREQTVYISKCLKGDVNSSVNILTDIVQNSKYDQNAIEEERGTILREYEEVNRNYDETLLDHLHATAFQESSHAYTILGSKDNIKSIQQDDIRKYVDTYYTGKRIVLVAAGGVKHDEIVKAAESTLGKLPSGALTHPKPVYTGSMVEIRDDFIPMAHIAVALKGPGNTSTDTYVIQVIQALMGNYDRSYGLGQATTSNLTQMVANEGQTSKLTSFSTFYRDIGLFGITAQVEHSYLENIHTYAIAEWRKLLWNLPSAALERAKTSLKTSLLLQLDGTQAVCEDIGRQLQYLSQRRSLSEQFSIIDRITASDVQRVIDQYVTDADPAIAVIGNTTAMSNYQFLRPNTGSILI
jgi:processing peptidase subunit beta